MIGIHRREPEPAIGYQDRFEALDRPRRLPRLRTLALIAVALAGLAVAGYFWVRSSSLSAVRHVRVAGLSGAEAGQIRRALETAARGMSTLNVQSSAFHNAVAAYPEIKSVTASASFPHSMTIHVTEQNPVAVVVAGTRRTVVSGDGTLLPSLTATSALPTITLSAVPVGPSLSGASRREAALLADAPSAAAVPDRVGVRRSDPRSDRDPARRAAPVLRRIPPAHGEVELGRGGARDPQLGGGRIPRCDRSVPPGGGSLNLGDGDAHPQVELYPGIRPKLSVIIETSPFCTDRCIPYDGVDSAHRLCLRAELSGARCVPVQH